MTELIERDLVGSILSDACGRVLCFFIIFLFVVMWGCPCHGVTAGLVCVGRSALVVLDACMSAGIQNMCTVQNDQPNV